MAQSVQRMVRKKPGLVVGLLFAERPCDMPEPGILADMKIENRGKIYFPWKKKSTSIPFFSLKIKMMDLWMQTEGTKLIFVMNFSVLDFFKFASGMPQIA